MIINASFRGPGGLGAHLRRVDTNERVVVLDDLSNGCSLEIDDAVADFAASGTACGVEKSIVHISISPEVALTNAQERSMIELVWRVYSIPPDHPMLVIKHEKPGLFDRPGHYHLVFPRKKSDGRLIKDGFYKIKNERIARELEFDFRHRLIPGPNIGAVRECFASERPDIAHAIEALQPPIRGNDSTTVSDKNFAIDSGADLAEFDVRVMAAWNSNAFIDAKRLNALGFAIAHADKAVMVIDVVTGLSQSLQRVVNRESKRIGAPLNLKQNQVQAKIAAATIGPLPSVRRAELHKSVAVSEKTQEEALALERHVSGALFRVEKTDPDFVLWATGQQTPPEELPFPSPGRKRRNKAAKTTIKHDLDVIRRRHREIAESRRRAADLAWRSVRIWRSKGLDEFAFWAGAGAAAVCGAGLLASIAAGAFAANFVVERGRQKLRDAKDASSVLKSSKAEIQVQFDQYFSGVRAARDFSLDEIPRHARIAAAHVFNSASLDQSPRQEVVDALNGVSSGLVEKIVAVERHSNSPKLRAIMKAMYPTDTAQAEHALQKFVERGNKPPPAQAEQQLARPRRKETDGFGR